MKRFITLVLAGIMMLSAMGVFAEKQPDVMPDILKVANERYADSIAEAIEKSKFPEEEIDKDNIYIIETKNVLIFEGGADYNQYYVALPSLKTEDIRFASFYKGEYQTEGMNTLSWLDKVETPQNTKIEEYINDNGLENVSEVVSMILSVSNETSGRATINAYKIITTNDTYYIPYFVDGEFNPANDENCALEMGKAYHEKDFADLMKAEAQAYLNYKKAEEERLAAEAEKEEEKYCPVTSLDENGDKIININGINLDDVLNDLKDNIEFMGFSSNIKMRIKTSDENYSVAYRWQKGCNIAEVSEFVEGLFDKLKTQVTSGKPNSSNNVSYCNFNLKHDESYTSVKHLVKISVWDDGVRIAVNKDDAIEFKVKNADAIINYLNKYGNGNFDGFSYEKNDENTPDIRSNIDGFTKTDIIEFDYKLPENIDNDISKEVATPGSTIHGTFERYKENKYRSTYILTLSGNLGTISLWEETQSSLSGEEELLSNNIPVSFYNKFRYENGNLVEYKIGKDSTTSEFKMIFKDNDISSVYFDNTQCTDLKYTQLTEDTSLSDEYVEKDKDAVLREAKECADTLYDFGLFKGTDKGYELEKSLTREESATILVRLLGEEDKLNADDFDEVFVDVDKDRWSYAYVMYCYENDITKGTGKNTFSPDVQIDASQFVTLLMRLLGYTEVNPDTAMVKSVEYNLLPADKAEELTKKMVFTRSDMVQIVYNSLKTQMKDETVFADYLLDKEILTEKEIEQIK